MADVFALLIEQLVAEGPIGMVATAQLLGTFRCGKPCHSSTPTRWCLTGVKLPDGRVLRLEHFRSARRLMTSKPALLRFLASQQIETQNPFPAAPKSPAQQTRDGEAASRELNTIFGTRS